MARPAKRHTFWNNISTWKQTWLTEEAAERRYAAGAQIGQPRREVRYLDVPVIQTGWVKIQGTVGGSGGTWEYDNSGPVLGVRGPGDLLETMGPLYEAMPAGAVALTEVRIWWLSHFRFLEGLTQHGILEAYATHLERLRHDELELIRARAKGMEAALARVLLQLYAHAAESRWANRRWDRPPLTLPPLTQLDLAQLAGVSLATVTRSLRRWREDNILSTDRCSVTIYRTEQLERLASPAAEPL